MKYNLFIHILPLIRECEYLIYNDHEFIHLLPIREGV